MSPDRVKVSSKYGAPMGRHNYTLGLGKLHLTRVRLDSGGYDAGGAYWGHGAPLWCVWDDEGVQYLRAASRAAVKAVFKETEIGGADCPSQFYR